MNANPDRVRIVFFCAAVVPCRAAHTHVQPTMTTMPQLAMIDGAKDIKVISFSLSFHGENLIEDTKLELSYGGRYGLIGRNGCGKSTFLEALASGDLELPPHIDRFVCSVYVRAVLAPWYSFLRHSACMSQGFASVTRYYKRTVHVL